MRTIIRVSLGMRGYLLVRMYSEVGKKGKRMDLRKMVRMMRRR